MTFGLAGFDHYLHLHAVLQACISTSLFQPCRRATNFSGSMYRARSISSVYSKFQLGNGRVHPWNFRPLLDMPGMIGRCEEWAGISWLAQTILLVSE